MNWVDTTIKDFGHAMGIENMALKVGDVIGLNFEKRGDLYFERLENEVLISLVRDVLWYGEKSPILRKALALCHYNNGYKWPVNAGVTKNNRIVFFVRVPEKDFSLVTLEEILEVLTGLHDQLPQETS